MNGEIILIAILACISFLTFLFGMAIYSGNVEAIAGYDPKKIADKKGYAKWVGSHIFFLSIYSLIFAILTYFAKIPLIGVWFFGISIICASSIIGSKKYEKKNTERK